MVSPSHPSPVQKQSSQSECPLVLLGSEFPITVVGCSYALISEKQWENGGDLTSLQTVCSISD